MNKFLLMLFFVSFSSFADTKTTCTGNDLQQFSSKTRDEILSNTYYPKIAQIKGVQGKGSVLISFDAAWNIAETKISQSTGFEILDTAMMDTVKNSNFIKPNCDTGRMVLVTAPFDYVIPITQDEPQPIPSTETNCSPKNILSVNHQKCDSL